MRSHADAAERAIEAGFDGVELHAGNGYLGMQFLTPNANMRTDEYGGSAANRVRFVVEALEAMGARIGFDRVGLKVTPGTTFNDMHDPDPLDTYRTLVDAIAHLPLAFIDVSPAEALVAEGHIDAALFGSAFIANPDLPARFGAGAALATPDTATFYTPGAAGYTDYPVMAGVQAA